MIGVGNQAEDPPEFTTAPLVVPVQPLPGEGLPDLVQRAAALNGYRHASDVLGLAHPGWKVVKSVGTSSIGRERALALVLGPARGADDIVPLTYPAIPERPGWHMFFGTPLRDRQREVTIRRVSPRALRQSLHGRAVWTIRGLCHDPHTRERLLDSCPECLQHLSFNRTLGMQFCDRCATRDTRGFPCGLVDLRDYPQPIVTVEDEEALHFVESLVDPLQANARWLPIGSPFESFARGEVYELVLALACTLATASESSTGAWRPKSRDSFKRIKPETLADAGRLILRWPDAFHSMVEHVRAARDERQGHFGFEKELGAMIALIRDRNLSGPLRAIVAEALRRCMAERAFEPGLVRRVENRHREDMFTAADASRHLGFARRRWSALANDPESGAVKVVSARRAPILFPIERAQELALRARDIITARDLSIAWGVPASDLASLSRRGLLARPDALSALLRGKGEFYVGSSVKEIETQLRRVRRAGRPPARSLPLRAVMAMRDRRIAPGSWATVVEAVIEGRLEVWRAPADDATTGFFGGLRVRCREAVSSLVHDERPAGDRRLTHREAATYLGTATPNVMELLAAGLLRTPLTLSGVLAFGDRFVMSTEVRELMRAGGLELRLRDVPPYLAGCGLEPHFLLGSKAKRVWNRAEVTAALRFSDHALAAEARRGRAGSIPCRTPCEESRPRRQP